MTPIPADPGPRDARHTKLVDARRLTYASLSDLRTQLQRGLAEPPPAYDQAVRWIPAVGAVEELTDVVSAYSGRRLESEPIPDAVGEPECCGSGCVSRSRPEPCR